MKISIIAGPAEPDAERAWAAVQAAVSAGPPADFVLLPARFLGDAGAEASAGLRAEVQGGLARLARDRHCFIVAGSLLDKERQCDITWLFDRRGELIHTRATPLSRGKERGDELFPVIATDCGPIGILNGSELWVLESTRILSLKGAELIFAPVQLTPRNAESKIASLWGLATLNCVAIAFASAPHATGLAYASVVLPSGVVTAADQHDGAPVYAEIEADRMRKLRDADLTFANTLWFGLWSRRKELYGPLVH